MNKSIVIYWVQFFKVLYCIGIVLAQYFQVLYSVLYCREKCRIAQACLQVYQTAITCNIVMWPKQPVKQGQQLPPRRLR